MFGFLPSCLSSSSTAFSLDDRLTAGTSLPVGCSAAIDAGGRVCAEPAFGDRDRNPPDAAIASMKLIERMFPPNGIKMLFYLITWVLCQILQAPTSVFLKEQCFEYALWLHSRQVINFIRTSFVKRAHNQRDRAAPA